MAEQPHTTGTAADPHSATPHTTGTAVPHGAEGKKIFPPLDPTTAAPLLVWLAITFTALYVLMSRFAIPRIGEVIEERRNRIQRDLDAAERLKGEVDQALATYEKALADARASASGIARETRDKLASDVERERAAVEADNQAKLAAAEARIAGTKMKALSSVGDIAADIAGPIVKQLIGKDVSADDVKRALQPAAGE